MNILHYSLGFPPYRSGGLTKFCMDLSQKQKEEGHEVGIIWPGRFSLFSKKRKVIKKDIRGITSYEIINPMPVSLMNGITDFNKYIVDGFEFDFMDFLRKIKPDYIHFHTLMGLPISFIDAAKKLNIKTIFTTHDYFGICPMVSLYNGEKICLPIDYENCKKCNKNAFSFRMIKTMQSPIYKLLKNFKFMLYLRQKIKKKKKQGLISNTNCDYKQLQKLEPSQYL